MKIVIRLLVIFALLGCVSFSAFGWDETGHKITAYIAWQRMTPETREKVIKTLLSAPEDAQLSTFYLPFGSRSEESRKREFFMMMATWPDIIRDKVFAVREKKYNNPTWHYSNTFWIWKDGNAVLVEGMAPEGSAMEKVTEFAQLIRGTAPDSEKAVAIAWLEHLIGDIHQPLHMSGKTTEKYPKGDKGGNSFFLTPLGQKGRSDNLHSFWDQIIGRYLPNNDQCDADYLDPKAQDIMKLYPYDKLKDKLNNNKFDVWGKESYDIATSFVYKDLKFYEQPSDKYKKKAFEIAQERMALAGYRMGDLFNEVFGAKPAVASNTEIPCKIIRKVMYPVTQTSSVKQTLEIALMDLCPTQPAARPMYGFMIDGKMVMKEYDVVRTFKTEAEARKYATENGITDVSF